MKYCSFVAVACLTVFSFAASTLAAGKGPNYSKLPVRPVKHVRSAATVAHGAATVAHSGECGCGATAVFEGAPVHCGASCQQSCGGCDDCDPCLLSLIFDDMCNAVDSLFSCKGCRSACGNGDVWDPCVTCEDSKPCRSRRSPRRRPKCDSCQDCSSLWDGFCEDSCGGACDAGSSCASCAGGSMPAYTHGGQMDGEDVHLHAAPPMELKDVPPPAPAGPNKAAARLKNSRSVLRSPASSAAPIRRTAVELEQAPTALPPAKPLPAKTKAAKPQTTSSRPAPSAPSKAPVLNAPQVNRTANATVAKSGSEVRQVAAEAPAAELEQAPAERVMSSASPILPANPLRSSQ